MRINKNSTTETQAPKQDTREGKRAVKAKAIKLGIDVHRDRYVVVRISRRLRGGCHRLVSAKLLKKAAPTCCLG
jgi:hypothetical protein